MKNNFFLLVLSLFSTSWAQLSSVTVTPANPTVGVVTNHTIAFTTTSSIPSNGRVVIDYSGSFQVNSAGVSSSSMDGTFSVSISGSQITIIRNNDGTATTAGSSESIVISLIVNSTSTGNYTINIQTQTGALTLIDSGTSSVFQITPTSLGSFTITNVPGSVTAGQTFPSSVTITALDFYSNIKTDFTGQVYFTSSDPQAQITYHSGSPYTFVPGDAGSHNFSGSGFQLRSTGFQTITVTNGSISRVSSNILVTPSSLASFSMTGVPTSVIAGQDFPSSIVVTARDSYGNTKTDFTGQVYFTSSDPQAQLTYHSGNRYTFTLGDNGSHSFSGAAFELRTSGSHNITVTNSTISQVSGSIQVSSSSTLAQFILIGIPASVQAGQNFPNTVTVIAADAFENPITTYDGPVTWSSSDGAPYAAVLPSDNGSGWISGQKQFDGSLFILYNSPSQTVTVHDNSNPAISTNSHAITVTPGPLASLIIRDNANGGGNPVDAYSMDVGTMLLLFSAGYDHYNNFIGDVNSNWTSDGTLMPVVSEANVSSFSFMPSQAGSGTIRAENPSNSSIYDNTGLISVFPGDVTHFTISNIISPKVASQSFPITVTALDASNTIATGFNGTVTISDLSNSITPTQSENFIQGVWTGWVTVQRSYTSNQIHVEEDGSLTPATGNSNTFNVISAPGIHISKIEAFDQSLQSVISSVTADQQTDWYLKCLVENQGTDQLQLDSIRVKILINGVSQTDYEIVYPTLFLGNNSTYLPGQSRDSLLIQISETGSESGPATIQGLLYMKNPITQQQFQTNAIKSISIHAPAQLKLYHVFTSQPEVTRGQSQIWMVGIVLRNQGGSDILIDSTRTRSRIQFKIGQNWSWDPLETLSSGSWIVYGGTTDTLLYTIDHSGDGVTGNCRIDAWIEGQEVSTGRILQQNTLGGTGGSVLIESPASLKILGVELVVPNDPYVNTSQAFQVNVSVRNNGGDAVNAAQVLFQTQGSIVDQATKIVGDLVGGQSGVISFYINAALYPDDSEIFITDVYGNADNTGEIIRSNEYSTTIIIQRPANLVVDNVVVTRDTVLGGQGDPWQVKVAVRNTGQATYVLNLPNADDLEFKTKGIVQYDYKVQPPTSLKKGGLELTAGKQDTLIYNITTTGSFGGSAQVTATIHGEDKNDESPSEAFGNEKFYVLSDPAFRIISTTINSLNQTESGNGFININQNFLVRVVVENGLRVSVRDIQMDLRRTGKSTIQDQDLSISRIGTSKQGVVEYQVKAPPEENILGDIFTSQILSATIENTGLDAPIGPALDSTAVAFIQKPAYLKMNPILSNPSGYFSTNQICTLTVSLQNMGSADVSNSGRIRIQLPINYILLSDSSTASISPQKSVHWLFRTPLVNHPTQAIEVTMYQFPRELNTGNSAYIEEESIHVLVTTVGSFLSTSLSISEPLGAADGILSTFQNFVLRALVNKTNVKDVFAEISLPPGYSTVDSYVKPVLSSMVFWTVTAPPVLSSSDIIQVQTSGIDSLDPGNPLYAETANLVVSTVPRAALSLHLSIISPPDAVDGSVSLGQLFEIEANITNTGIARTIGDPKASILTLPEGYIATDGITKDISSGSATWLIQAPIKPSIEAVNIEVGLTKIPIDENTQKEAFVSKITDKVAVTTVNTWLSAAIVPRPDSLSGLVPSGQPDVWIMGLEFINRGEKGANGIVINSMRFDVYDLMGNEIENPNWVLTHLKAVRLIYAEGTYVLDMGNIFGEVYSNQMPIINPVEILFTKREVIAAEDTLYVGIVGSVPESSPISGFQLVVPSSDYIDARDEYSPQVLITPLGVGGNQLDTLKSYQKQILPREQLVSSEQVYLVNCPNPFGEPGKEKTTIIYYLEESMDIKFRIFTLTGELVWSRDFTGDDPQSQPGLHSTGSQSVEWDGVNDRDHKVLNGVYILVMQTGDGRISKTKVAVVK